MTTNTTIAQKAARRKLTLLELASDLDNVRGPRNPHPSRLSEELEQVLLDYCLEYPTQGSLKVSQQLLLRGIHIGAGSIRGVWQRRNLLSKHQRLLRLEQHAKETGMELSEQEIRLLERFDPEFRERHIQADFTGQLVAIDTFMVGNLKGIGKVYLQTVVDRHSRYAWGHLYNSKIPVTAVHVLNERVLPFFEEHGARIHTILSDNGREYCGRPDQHPFELFLQLEDIEHRTTQVRRTQSNGIVERLHRTLLDEHFRIVGRTKFYESLGEMQLDLDDYLKTYNQEGSVNILSHNLSGGTHLVTDHPSSTW